MPSGCPKMSVTYAPSYIDQVFVRRDALALHTIISVRSRTAPLPDECVLFTRVLEWLGSDWQYYEAIREQDYIEVCRLMKKFSMNDVLKKYQEGRSAGSQGKDLSQWFMRREAAIHAKLFQHANRAIEFLKKLTVIGHDYLALRSLSLSVSDSHQCPSV